MNNLKFRIDTIPPNVPPMHQRVPVFPSITGIAALRLAFGGYSPHLDSVPGCGLRLNASPRADGVQEMQKPPSSGRREPGLGANAAARGLWRSV